MPKSSLAALARAFTVAVAVAHVIGASVCLELLPGGFALTHPRFIANRLAPCLVIAVSAWIAAAAWRRARAYPALLTLYPSGWLGLGVGTWLAFPESGQLVAEGFLGGAALLSVGALLSLLKAPDAWRTVVVCALPAGAVGLGLPLTQRAPAPSTQPTGASAEESRAGSFSAGDDLQLGPKLLARPRERSVVVRSGPLQMEIHPLLEFISRSPDRFWTLFANQTQEDRSAPVWATRSEAGLHFKYAGAALSVSSEPSAVTLGAWTLLREPVFSHLNAFSRLGVIGHRQLSLTFSPCADVTIPFTHSDYPVGAPARFAYLDASGLFRVVQATSAEKGPFKTLASGKLARGQPLTMTLIDRVGDQARPIFAVRFDDWSSQVSVEVSPTAGWGVTQNAIEFGLTSAENASPAYVTLTLAGTSVGRGWDSVGHRAGTYANRMRVELPH